jgi:transcriptional regulator with XRE-family HTH domain
VLAGLLAIASTFWLTEDVSPVSVGSIGEYIRQQREQAKISLRQLASAAGVSNPYLSQIERRLRRPSAEILQQIAKGLRISAEALYVQAGILEDRRPDSGVRAAVLADPDLAERQKQVLLEIYESFRRETALNAEAIAGAEAADPGPGPDAVGTVPRSAGPEGPSADGAGGESVPMGSIPRGSTGTGSPGTGSTGAGSTGGGSTGGGSTGGGSTGGGSTGTGSTGTGSTGGGSDGTDQESSGAEAPARNPRRPARSGQGE